DRLPTPHRVAQRGRQARRRRKVGRRVPGTKLPANRNKAESRVASWDQHLWRALRRLFRLGRPFKCREIDRRQQLKRAMVTSVPSPWERAMRPLFLSWKTIVSVGTVFGLLLIVGPSSPTPALAGNMGGGGGHGGGGHWSGGGGGVGVGVGIGVGS